jgi:hypothetical protein
MKLLLAFCIACLALAALAQAGRWGPGGGRDPPESSSSAADSASAAELVASSSLLVNYWLKLSKTIIVVSNVFVAVAGRPDRASQDPPASQPASQPAKRTV